MKRLLLATVATLLGSSAWAQDDASAALVSAVAAQQAADDAVLGQACFSARMGIWNARSEANLFDSMSRSDLRLQAIYLKAATRASSPEAREVWVVMANEKGVEAAAFGHTRDSQSSIAGQEETSTGSSCPPEPGEPGPIQ